MASEPTRQHRGPSCGETSPGGAVEIEQGDLPQGARRGPAGGGPARASWASRPGGTRIELRGPRGPVVVGGPFVVMAGPCAVESATQAQAAARIVAEAGCGVLRGGAFKPRTSPYAF